MKKITSIFLTITFWMAVVCIILFLVFGVIGLALSQTLIAELIKVSDTTTSTIEEITVLSQVTIYTLFISLLVASVVLIGPLVLCPITKRKLEKAKSKNEMVLFGVLNLFFGSAIAGIMILVMDDSYYQNKNTSIDF